MNGPGTVVVVGGGVVGASTAYHLALRGHTDVVVLERDAIASGPSGRAAGIVMGVKTGGAMHGDEDGDGGDAGVRTTNRLRQYAKGTFDDFAADGDLTYHRPGYLHLCTDPARVDEYRGIADVVGDLGDDVEFLDVEGVTAVLPDYADDGIHGAIYGSRDGWVDPHDATFAFVDRARERGVEVRTGEGCTGLEVEDGRIRRVVTGSGTIDADHVVAAAGAWTPRVGAMVDVDVPITPYRRQVALIDPGVGRERPVPATYDPSTGFYFREDTGGNVLFGVHDVTGYPGEEAVDPDRYDGGTDEDFLLRVGEYVDDRFPGWSDAEVVDGWACHYATTPDGLPIIGRPSSPENFLVCAGFNGGGIARSPVAGRLAADLVLDGEGSLVEDVPFVGSDRLGG